MNETTDTKTCRTCSIAKPLDHFYRRKSGWVHAHCKPCEIKKIQDCKNASPEKRERYLEYQRSYGKSGYRKDRRVLTQNLVAQIKAAPCMDCKRSFPPECMDFDHRDPGQKIRSVAYMAASGWAESTIRAEIAKCDLVCACCHRTRTAKQQNWHPGPTRSGIATDA